jgi:hypothetical protein
MDISKVVTMEKQSFDKIENPVYEGKIGRGLTNGNGFTNGFAAANAPREPSRSNSEPAAKSDIQTNSNGLTNGNGFTVGNGVTNGNGVGSKPSRIPMLRSKRIRGKIMGLALAVFLILAPLSLYLVDFTNDADGIVIDGDFRDWNGLYRHTDSSTDMSSRPNVNIVETSIQNEGDMTAFLLVVDGWIFEGGGSNGADTVYTNTWSMLMARTAG